jgi:hypothetical protein
MSSSTYGVFFMGYMIGTDEDLADEMAEACDCEYVYFNEGYDTEYEYVLVPKELKGDGIDIDLLNPVIYQRLADEIDRIWKAGVNAGYKLPKATCGVRTVTI